MSNSLIDINQTNKISKPNLKVPQQQQFVNKQQFISTPVSEACQLPCMLPTGNGAKKRKCNNNIPIILPQQLQQQTPKLNSVDAAELKKQQRIIRNRISAQMHRERKFAYITSLETQVKEKDRIISDLRSKVDCLNNQIVELSNMNISLQDQLKKSLENQVINKPLPITDEIISSDEGANKTNSATSSPISSDDYSSESSTGSPEIGIISDVDSPNINSHENFFHFEPNFDENDYLFFNTDNIFSSSSSNNNNNNNSHSNSFNQYNSIIIGLLIFTLPLLFLANGLPSVGFGVTRNEIRMNNNNNNYRFLVENEHFPALPDAIENPKLNPFVSNPPPDPALKSFNDKSSDMSKAISIYKHKPLNNDIFALKRWESKLHDQLKNNANDVSKQLFSKRDDVNSKNNHLRHDKQHHHEEDYQRKYNSSYLMCPNAFGKMLLYDGSYITDENNNILNLTNINTTNCEKEGEKPFLLLLIPRHHIQLEGDYNESENDKAEWVEISCNVVRSRIVRNLAM